MTSTGKLKPYNPLVSQFGHLFERRRQFIQRLKFVGFLAEKIMKKHQTFSISTCERAITASVIQTQGKQTLTHNINEISVCATTNDVVTLPPCAPGLRVLVINNGAQTLQIYPSSGDDLGGGANASTTLATTKSAEFVGYNNTNWIKFTN